MSDPARVPPGWLSTRLGDLGRYLNGRGFGKKEWSKSGRPIIRIQNLTGTSSKFNYYSGDVDDANIARPGDLLMSWAATLDAFIWPGPEGCVNQHIFKVESFIDKHFHLYLLRNALDELYRKTHGSGMVHITRAKFDATPAAVPPIPEQRRIVAKIEELFSDLDAGVAALERVRANLKRYRAAVLKAAVEGRLTEEWRTRHPATEPAAKHLERILAERRAKWEQDQLRKFKEAGKTPPKGWKEKYEEPGGPSTVPEIELPPTWSWTVADQLCGTITDGEHITPPRTDSGVLLLSARNVVDGRLRFDEVDYISQATYATLCKRLRIVPGDVLMSCSGTVGRSCVAPEGLDFSLVRSVAVLKPVLPFGTFLSMAIRSILLQHQVSEKKSQTAQANIFQGKIKRLVFPFPPLAEQIEIIAEVDRRLTVADAAETQVEHALQRAARLRQAILKRAFEGRLVPQDPADEPAAAMLARIHTTGECHPLKAAPAQAVRTPRRKRVHA